MRVLSFADMTKTKLDIRHSVASRRPLGVPLLLAFITATWAWQLTGHTAAHLYGKVNGYEADTCHDIYMEQSTNASSTYSKNFEQCETAANNSIAMLTLDEETERAQLQAGADKVCGNLQHCNSNVNDLDYFGCMVDIGPTNLNILVDIRFNASTAYLQLRDDIDAVQQQFLLCSISASHEFVIDMRNAYEELLNCRVHVDLN